MNEASWVDRSAYLFQPDDIHVEGGRMHYADEGQGRPLVMVHGTPTWSFLYRCLIDLFPKARAVAYPQVGHFVPDEAGPESVEEVRAFLYDAVH